MKELTLSQKSELAEFCIGSATFDTPESKKKFVEAYWEKCLEPLLERYEEM
jgi:hypothetical protein